MAETQPTGSASAASPQIAPAVDEKASHHSPAVSDKTVVPAVTDHPAASTSPHEQKQNAPEIVPMPHTNQAVLTTDLGRQSYHPAPGPPGPPLVVRSDKMQGVADFAQRMFANSREQYLGYFPECGWTIYDLWDSVDIAIDSPPFLEEVLKYITFDNVHRMRAYAVEWSEKNRDRLDFIGGDLTSVYDPNDHLAIVDKIFINGEMNAYPRIFLWHVAHFMRTGMMNVALKKQAMATATNVKANDNHAGKTALNSKPVAEPTSKAAEEENQPRPETTPGSGHRKTNRKKTRPTRKKELTDLPELVTPSEVIPLVQPSIVAPNAAPPPVIPSTPATLQIQSPQAPQAAPAQPPYRGYQTHPSGFGMGGPAPMLSPHMNPANLRNPKGRNPRQGSSSYNQPMPPQVWMENYPAPPISGHQSRQPSGAMSVMQSPRFNAPIPMAQPMMNPTNSMMPYHQNPSMMSSSMPPGQMHYGPMNGPIMHPGMMQPQSAPFSASPMEFAMQNYPHGPSVPRGMSIGDMTNNPQYPYNTPPSHVDQRAGMNRYGSQTNKQPGLFNPYGAEKPDFGMIPGQPGNRKAARNSFSNNTAGRGRKFSNGSHTRLTYGQYNFDRGDQNGPYGGNRHQEAPFVRNFSNNSYFKEVDPTITGDPERGCGEQWIGPQNDYVTFLWIYNLPQNPDPTVEELKEMFQGSVNVPVTNVRIQHDKNNNPIAYVQ